MVPMWALAPQAPTRSAQETEDIMSTVPTTNSAPLHSPFSEVRDAHRQATLAVIATTTVTASASLIAALLIALGVSA